MKDYFFLVHGTTEKFSEKYRYRNEIRERIGNGHFKRTIRLYLLPSEHVALILTKSEKHIVEKYSQCCEGWQIEVSAFCMEELDDDLLFEFTRLETRLDFSWRWNNSTTFARPEIVMRSGELANDIKEIARVIKRLKWIPSQHNKQGRPRSLRTEWIIDRSKQGLSPSQIRDLWDAGGKGLWQEIDPINPVPYNNGDLDWKPKASVL